MQDEKSVNRPQEHHPSSDDGEVLRATAAKQAVRAASLGILPAPSGKPMNLEMSIKSAGDLGILIRQARLSGKFTQQEFADLVGVGRRFLSEVENGKPTAEFGKVLQVAYAAGIDIFAKAR